MAEARTDSIFKKAFDQFLQGWNSLSPESRDSVSEEDQGRIASEMVLLGQKRLSVPIITTATKNGGFSLTHVFCGLSDFPLEELPCTFIGEESMPSLSALLSCVEIGKGSFSPAQMSVPFLSALRYVARKYPSPGRQFVVASFFYKEGLPWVVIQYEFADGGRQLTAGSVALFKNGPIRWILDSPCAYLTRKK